MSYNVKGSSINTKLAYVREHFGEEGENAILETVENEDLRTILDSSWYPFELYVEVLNVIAKHHFGGNLAGLQEVGRYSAATALRSTYRAFLGRDSYTGFLGRISSLHHMLYSDGKSEIQIGEDGTSCKVVLSGKPTIAEEDLQIALGFYLGCGVLYGHESVRGSFTQVDGEGHFHLEWD